jgi:hypothetical protein
MRVTIFLAVIIATTVPAFARFVALGAMDVTIRDSVTAKPIAGATVLVSSPNYRRETVTDQTGRFTLDYLQPGTYIIEARMEGYSQSRQSVDVVAGRVSAVALSIVPALRWIVRVMDVHWPEVVSPGTTADVYVPVWGRALVDPFDSAFQILSFAPGLTFGRAQRMMR